MKIKKLLAALLSGVIILVSFPMTAFAEPTDMTIYSINVGAGNNGDSTLVKSGDSYLLMDMGVRESYSNVKAMLDSLGVECLSVYLSHFHGDHTGGFSDSENAPLNRLMQDYTVENIYLPDPSLLQYKGKDVEKNASVYYRKMESFFTSAYPERAYEESVNYLSKGSSFTFGTVNVDIIGPVGMDGFKSPYKNKGDAQPDEDLLDDYQNNCSLVAKLQCGNVSFLTAGDTKTDGENALIKEYASTGVLNSTIYKMSHHGMYPANGSAFVDCVKPDYSFVSNYAAKGKSKSDGNEFWEVHTAQYNCLKYGFVYLSGQEDNGITIDVKDDVVSLYRNGSTTKLNAPGWTKVKGSDGKYRTDDYFYFGADGKTMKGVQKIDGKYYYLGTGGYRHYGTGKGSTYKGMITCSEDNIKRYFEESDGSMYTGFHTVKNNEYNGLYYFAKKTGELLTAQNGTREKRKIGDYYYSVYKSGLITQNSFIEYDGGSCYFGSDGKMATGWKTIDGNKYYLSKKTGCRYTGFKKVGDYYYLFSSYGIVQTGWKNVDGKKHYFNTDGKMQTGWKTISGKKYYFDTNTGAIKTGLVTIKGYKYLFSDAGVMQTGWKNIKGNKCYFNSNGKMATGWKTISKKKYYFDTKTGYAKKGVAKIGKNYYLFSDYCVLVTNTKRVINGKKYTITKDGVIKGYKP